jgi:hypothetical protein
VESGGIKIGPEPSQNVILRDNYSSGMMSFLISSRNGPRNGQKGMHQERNDRNTHYLLLINISKQFYYFNFKQLIVHGQIEHQHLPMLDLPMLDLVSSTFNNTFLHTTIIIHMPRHHHRQWLPPATTVSTHHPHRPPTTTTAYTNNNNNEVAMPRHQRPTRHCANTTSTAPTTTTTDNCKG